MYQQDIKELSDLCHSCNYDLLFDRLTRLSREHNDPVLSDQIAFLAHYLDCELDKSGIRNFYSKVEARSLELNQLFQRCEEVKQKLLDLLAQFQSFFQWLDQAIVCSGRCGIPCQSISAKLAACRQVLINHPDDEQSGSLQISQALESIKKHLDSSFLLAPESSASAQSGDRCYIRQGLYCDYMLHMKKGKELKNRIRSLRDLYSRHNQIRSEIAEKAEFFHLEDTYGELAEQLAQRFEADLAKLLLSGSYQS